MASRTRRPVRGDGARGAALAGGVGVALAVAGLGGGAAAAADALVAGLDRLGLLAAGVVEVRLDRGRGAAERLADLRNRQTFRVPVVAGELYGSATFRDAFETVA